MKLEMFANNPKLFKKYEGEVMRLMMAPWLPEEPVGIGARWQIQTPVSVAQRIRSKKVTISQLVKADGAVITIETTTTEDAPKQRVNGGDYEGITTRATKRITVDLADPVSLVPISFEMAQGTSMTRKKLGNSITHKMNITSSSERIGDAVKQD